MIIGTRRKFLSLAYRFVQVSTNFKIPARHFYPSTTVDADEVEKFSKLAENFWDENGPLKPLHSMNCLRVPWIRDVLQNQQLSSEESGKSKLEQSNAEFSEILIKPLKNKKILDVGCGAGLLCEPLCKLGAEVIGLDVTNENIVVAEAHVKNLHKNENLNLRYFAIPVEEFAKNAENFEKFDAVIASEVVEHVADCESFIKNCAILLKPQGTLFITTINKTLVSNILAIYVAENLLNVVPRGVHDFEKFVPPENLEFLLERENLSVRLIHGLCYNPLTNHWRWIRDTSVNYGLYAVKNF